METIEIKFKNKIYVIEKDKLFYILSSLENKKIKKLSEEEIIGLLKKYDLFDNFFLNSINKI